MSFCEDDRDVHYNPYVVPMIVSVWNIENISNPTMIYGSDLEEYVYIMDYFTLIEVDGESIDLAQLEYNQGRYTFPSSGEHIIKYAFLDDFFSENTFDGCTGLTSVEIPNGFTTIPALSFANCTSLTSVTIPNSVTEIGGSAFASCSGLTSVTIPNRVTSIRNNAFYSCSRLASVTVEATTPPTLENYAFANTNCPIYVPSGSVNAYKSASGWSNYSSRIQAIPTT